MLMANSAPLVVQSLAMHDVKGREVVGDVSIEVKSGEVLALIGESGSGKTSVALSILGFARPGMYISSGRILIDGQDILKFSAPELRNYRGRVVSLVPQNPTSSFSPRMRIGKQMAELLVAHGYGADEIQALVKDALRRVDLPSDESFLRKYPFELSGGQLQRVAIGMAFISNPKVIVMDEPTTGLDVSTQQTILSLISRLVLNSKSSFVYVTHDLAVVNVVAHRVAVMHAGRIVELGERKQVFTAPRHEYTRMLLASMPMLPPMDEPLIERPESFVAEGSKRSVSEAPVLDVQDLKIFHGRFEAVHGISFSIAKGECVALVGGSGSGKTTTGRCIAGLNSSASGRMTFEGRELAFGIERRSRKDLAALQTVFQNPDRSLNPRESVAQAIGRVLRLSGATSTDQISAETCRLLDKVRLPRRALKLYPSDLSGGERQRVAIARALAMKPRLLVCDEITSALDVSVQSAIVDLLRKLKEEGLAMLFITHNLPLVSEIAQTVLIMKDGNIVESGNTHRVLCAPQDAYSSMLLAAAPRMDRMEPCSKDMPAMIAGDTYRD